MIGSVALLTSCCKSQYKFVFWQLINVKLSWFIYLFL